MHCGAEGVAACGTRFVLMHPMVGLPQDASILDSISKSFAGLYEAA